MSTMSIKRRPVQAGQVVYPMEYGDRWHAQFEVADMTVEGVRS